MTTRHPTAWDAVIGAACFLVTVAGPGVISDARPVVLIFAAVSALPLTWRRRAPLPVALVCGVGSIGLMVAHGNVDWPYGQLVATYTVAAHGSVAARVVLAAGTVAGVVFTQQTLEKAPGSILTSGGVFATAFAIGVAARARHDRIALLEERALRHAEEREKAAAHEREAIARDMHDILAHSMTLIAVQAEAGPLLVHRDPDRAARVFDTISDTAHDTLVQLRGTLGVLRAGRGERAPHPDLTGIAALAERARSAGLAVTVAEDGEPETVVPEVAVATYRLVQESLTNVVRHAGATTVRIGLDWSPTRLRVEIADDGHGASVSTGGHGLIGMRERVTACGGAFHAGTSPSGDGFVVTATFALPARATALRSGAVDE
ncbi:sensor histidine kinase [Amycolatopsis pigmentata]|uniref:histidine kinase n=1 Tax=Amycolatopsis pigmentata TaxID=450801 RepID=A0ABW5FUB3_9PSEU